MLYNAIDCILFQRKEADNNVTKGLKVGLPLYNQPCDTAVFQLNKQKYVV